MKKRSFPLSSDRINEQAGKYKKHLKIWVKLTILTSAALLIAVGVSSFVPHAKAQCATAPTHKTPALFTNSFALSSLWLGQASTNFINRVEHSRQTVTKSLAAFYGDDNSTSDAPFVSKPNKKDHKAAPRDNSPAAAPANDDCSNAPLVTPATLNYTDTVDTSGATDQAGEPASSCTVQSNSVWYKYTNTTANDVLVTVSTCTSNFDTAVGVWNQTGASCDFGGFVGVACNDDACGDGLQSQTSFFAHAGQTYMIQAGGFDGETGTLTTHIDSIIFTCPTTVIHGTLGSGSPDHAFTTGNQTGRLNRNGVSSSCATPKVCNIFTPSGSRAYDAYVFPNTSGADACALTHLDVNTPAGANYQVNAYLDSYDPNNICTNYLGDPGLSSGGGPQMPTDMSTVVPNGHSLVLVVQTTNPGESGGLYTLTLLGNLCTPNTDLSITKTDGVTAAPAGSTVTYTVTASNAGPNNAPGSTVTDTFPASLTANWTCAGAGGGTCTASGSGNINDTVNLPVGGSVTYTIAATISPGATGTLSNTATVTAPAGVLDSNPANNSATDSDTLTSQANLGVTKTDGVTTATPGGSVTYTITASNAGPSNVTGATVADTFPASLTGTWTCVGAGGGTCTASGSGNINNTVNLPAGGSVTYTVSATISSAATGTLSNTATVTAPAGVTDPTPGNNSATDADTLTPQADLSITKTDGVTTATPGGSVTYTITASNAGPSSVTGATVADTFPASLTGTWTCVGAGGGTCTASGSGNINNTVNLPAGASVTYTVSATISSAATGTLSNTATVTAPGGITDPNPGNNSATDADTLTPQANLGITKTDGVTTTVAGSSVIYTLVVSNAGPSNAVGSTVVDTLPAAITNATWICAGVGGGLCSNGSGTGSINQTVNLPVGSSVTYTVSAAIDPAATGTLSNTATVTAAAGITDPTPGNNSATDTDTLTPPLVFAIDDVRKNEGNTGTTAFVFTVTRLALAGTTTASVQYTTQDGSATAANGDYQPVSGTLTFAVGEATKTITVLVNGDTVVEPDEFFTVHLFSPSSGTAIQDPDGQGLIFNDDGGGQVPTPTPTPAGSGFEGDINRTAVGVPGTGDGDVTVGDQIQFLRFLAGLDCPSVGTANPALNEQQRLDAGPRNILGDGLLGAADASAIDAYARHDASTDFNPNVPNWQPTPTGGPKTISNLGPNCSAPDAPEGDVEAAAPAEAEVASAARVVRVVSRSGARDSVVTVDIEMMAQGNEAGTQYGLLFDPTVLAISDISGVNINPDVLLGAGAPEGTKLNVNAADAASGNIGIVENFNGAVASISAIPAGTTRIARVRFHVLDGAASGTSRVDFDTSLIRGVTSDVNGIALSANYEGGDISVGASRGVMVSGRVTSSDGRGVRGATVTIVDGDGLARTVTTSSFGYYTFEDVAAATYTIGVASRQYRFGSRTITVGENLADIDFTGLE